MASLEDPETPREPLSAIDHAWLRMDEPSNLMIINGVLVLDGPADFERIKALLKRRLSPIPRFHQRIVNHDGEPYWEEDPELDIERHVHRLELPAPGDDGVLRDVVSRLMTEPLDPRRPLWSFHLLAGYKGQGSLLMGRLHHCIGDGMALLLVLLSLTDVPPDVSPEMPPETLPGPAAAEELDSPFTDLFRRPARASEAARELAERIMPDGIRLMQQSAEAFRSMSPWATGAASIGAFTRLVLRLPDPSTVFKGPLGIPKRVAWSEAIAVEDVKEVGRALAGTVNDVLLSAMTGGLRRYLLHKGKSADGLNFRAAMPVNLRSLDDMADLGNQFGLIFLSLPVGIADAVERLAELRRRSLALRRSAEPVVVYAILKLLGVVPLAVQRLVVSLFAAKTTAVMTNVPGPREELTLAGKPIRDIFFWVPQSGRVGLGISIFSYAGHVRLGIASDTGLIPDPELVVAGFHEEFAALQERARQG
ncbi:MAG TPA: wax ester/triacylglycerol synthase family O-acyltransferase [Thermoanaerobaculia bacterium]